MNENMQAGLLCLGAFALIGGAAWFACSNYAKRHKAPAAPTVEDANRELLADAEAKLNHFEVKTVRLEAEVEESKASTLLYHSRVMRLRAITVPLNTESAPNV